MTTFGRHQQQEMVHPIYQQRYHVPFGQEEESIEHRFHLFKYGANPTVKADESVVKFSANASARGRFKAAPTVSQPQPKPKPWFKPDVMDGISAESVHQTRIVEKQHSQRQPENQPAADGIATADVPPSAAIQVSTFSERQANDEVFRIKNAAQAQKLIKFTKKNYHYL
jgi:hypothetical protein